MALDDVAASLDPVLSPHGFRMGSTASGRGSGGHFEAAQWTRDDRQLRIWRRSYAQQAGQTVSLSVGYRLGEIGIGHAEYMRAQLGPRGANRFPTHGDDPVAALQALVHDIREYAGDFLTGNDEAFLAHYERAQADRHVTGFQRLQSIEQRLRAY